VTIHHPIPVGTPVTIIGGAQDIQGAVADTVGAREDDLRRDPERDFLGTGWYLIRDGNGQLWEAQPAYIIARES
jgi:hypothetical protein